MSSFSVARCVTRHVLYSTAVSKGARRLFWPKAIRHDLASSLVESRNNVRRLSTNSNKHSHSSLSSFLTYAHKTSLSRDSTVFNGTLYEYQCQEAMIRLGFSLERSGGAGDAGIDLRGTWVLPSLPEEAESLQVIVQCKALARKTGPNLVRELEGALAPRPRRTIGVLCATKPATKGVIDTLRNSRSPMIWMQIEQIPIPGTPDAGKLGNDDSGDRGDKACEVGPPTTAKIRQMLWNEEVERLGTRGLSVGLVRNKSSDRADEEVVLLWEDEVWEPRSSG